jgi:hypothetical protein
MVEYPPPPQPAKANAVARRNARIIELLMTPSREMN